MEREQAYEILKNKTYKDETEKQNCLDIIKTEPEWSYLYALYVMKGRWIEAEEYIKKDPDYAYYYARNVIKDRWIEAEEYIKKDPSWAYAYARDVIERRWKEAEEYIKKDPQYAYYYARNVIKGRWLEAEEYIKSSTVLVKYCKSINQRVVEKEHLLKDRSKIDYYTYFNIPLDEEDYNKEIANALIGKKSKYLAKIQKEKNLAKKHIQNLIKLGVISKDQTIENLIKKL